MNGNDNPYDPPADVEPPTEYVERATRLPDGLVKRARRSLQTLAFVAIVAPLLVAAFVNELMINPLVLAPLTVGMTMDRRSFKSFPWTVLACWSFVIVFGFVCQKHSVVELANWLPRRFSPVLSLHLACAALGAYSGWLVWKCHQFHKLEQIARTNRAIEDDEDVMPFV